MSKSKKENTPEKENNSDVENVSSKKTLTPYVFIITWAAIGAFALLSVNSNKKIDRLVAENERNLNKINNIEVENKVLLDKIQEAERSVDKLSIDLQVFAEKHSQNTDELAQNQVNEEKEQLPQAENQEAEQKQNQVAQISEDEVKKVAEEAVQRRLEDYEKMSYDRQELSAGLNDVSDRTAYLEEKIDNVSEQVEKARLDNFSNNLVLSAVKLREAVNKSQSFESELKAFKFFAKDYEDLKYYISILEEHSKEGIVTFDKLQKDFDKISNEILNVSRKNKDNPTVIDKVTMKLSDLVKVRKIDSSSNSSQTDDILARAYKAIQNKNIEKAIREVESLEGEDKILISPWLEEANSYVDSKNASEEIFVEVSDKVADING
jgi:hypothetical protein